jgi:hypothetical protein
MSIPGGANALAIGSSAVTDATYDIARSLKFESSDSSNLTKGSTTSNNGKFTVSFWFKPCQQTSRLFGNYIDGNNYFLVTYNYASGDGKLAFQSVVGGTDRRRITLAVYRDYSNWYNVVIVGDNSQSTSSNVLKVFVNGKLAETEVPSGYTDYAQDMNFKITGGTHRLGSNANWGGNYYSGLLADFHYVDGYCATSTNNVLDDFGEIDADTGVWNPVAFDSDNWPTPAVTTVNTGVTWSTYADTVTGWASSGGVIGKLFDGNVDSGDWTDSATSSSTSSAADWDLGSSKKITGVSKLRIHVYLSSNQAGQSNRIKVNGTDVTAACLAVGHSAFNWVDISSSFSEFQSIWIYASYIYISAIEVNGQVLTDGLDDPTGTGWNNCHITFQDNATTTKLGYDYGPRGEIANANNGLPIRATTDTYGETKDGNNLRSDSSAGTTGGAGLVLAIPGDVLGTNYSSYWGGTAGNEYAQTDGGSFTGTTSSGYVQNAGAAEIHWTPPTPISISSSLKVFVKQGTSGQLELNDSSVSTTNNAWTEIATSGTLTKLSLLSGSGSQWVQLWAVEIDGTVLMNGAGTDVHATLNTGSTAKPLAVTGSVAVSTANSRFYGSSMLWASPGTNYIEASAHADYGFSGAFTIEMWWYIDVDQGFNCPICSKNYYVSGSNGNWYLSCHADGSNNFQFYSYDGQSSGQSLIVSTPDIKTKTWHHIAVTRDGSNKTTLWLDGIAVGSNTSITRNLSDGASNGLMIGGLRNNGSWQANARHDGNIQDLRIYKLAKYTDTFIPPTRQNWTVNNFIAQPGTSNFTTTGYTVTKDGTTVTQSDLANAFDGSTTTKANLTYNNNTWSVLTFNTALTGVTKLRVWCAGTGPIGYNGGSQATMSYSGSGQWQTLLDGSSTTINSIRGQSQPGNGVVFIYAIEVNGTILTDTKSFLSTYQIDSVTDSPTNGDTDDDDGTGGAVPSNYCTLNPLDTADNSGSQTIKEGNLYHESTSSAGAWHVTRGTVAIPKGSSGKFYYEVKIVQREVGDTDIIIGWADPFTTIAASGLGVGGGEYAYYASSGNKFNSNSSTSYGNSYTTGDVIGVGYDNGSLYFWKNGTIQNSGTAAWTGVSKDLIPSISVYTQSSKTFKAGFNFGQLPFDHKVADYKTISTINIATLDQTIKRGDKHFDVISYTGNGASPRSLGGLSFQPDLVWIKERSQDRDHQIYDVVRGAGNANSLAANTNYAQDAQDADEYGYLSAFTSDGFTLTAGTHGSYNDIYTNDNGQTYIAWCWDLGASAATPGGGGDITATTQWKNTTAGFSVSKVVKPDGTTNQTFEHGLGVQPKVVLQRRYDVAEDFYWYVVGLTSSTSFHWFQLNTSSAKGDTGTPAPTASVATLMNAAGNYLVYCFADVYGYLKCGHYIGNGETGWPNADGTFVYTGHRSQFLIVKADAGENWVMYDNTRKPYNYMNKKLIANGYASEVDPANNHEIDFLSNGFKIRNNTGELNTSGTTYMYFSIAEVPFSLSRAF